MNTRCMLSLFGCALTATSLSCYKKIKVSANFVNPGLQITPYVYTGGRLLWWNGTTSFKVHFITPIPCLGEYPNDIPGSPGKPAVCDIPAGTGGEYAYQILPLGGMAVSSGPSAPTLWIKAASKPCDGCDSKRGPGNGRKKHRRPLPEPQPKPVGAPANGGPPTTHIICNSPGTPTTTVEPQPVEAYPGDAVSWAQAGSDTLKWTATFSDTHVCTGQTAFGTKDPQSPVFCSVNPSFDFGGQTYLDFKYTITLSAGGCTDGSATLRVLKPPQH